MRRYNYRLDVTKRNEAGFLSHREFLQVICRGLLRTGLSIHTSGGHKWPSPKISVLNPLPTGIESEHELVTFKLCSYHAPSEVRKRMSPIPFPGLDVIDVIPLARSSRPSIREMRFCIRFDSSVSDVVSIDGREDGNGDGQKTSSVPEQVLELELSNQTCSYRTGSDGHHIHPETMLDWLQEQSDQPLPPVRKMVKTDIIISER